MLQRLYKNNTLINVTKTVYFHMTVLMIAIIIRVSLQSK